ncbi:MAG: hypothetical protein ACERKZ_03345 [Lachnotalea sp.]
MSETTTVVCGVKNCKHYSNSGCKKKVVVIDLVGKCLTVEKLTAVEQAKAVAIQKAAERALEYET